MLRKKASGVTPKYLKTILSTGSDVKFINSFHGVPVSSDGKILDIDDTSVRFSTPKPQLLCIRNDFFTLIKHPSLPTILRAEVVDLDWDNGTFEVSLLHFLDGSAGKRSLHRVETESPIQAQLVTQNMRRKFRIELTELSTGGLSFYIHRAFFKKKEIRIGQDILVHYRLPDFGTNLPGTSISQKCLIRNVIPGWGNQYYRVGAQNLSKNNFESHINFYIAQRQNIILKEISEICEIEDSLI